MIDGHVAQGKTEAEPHQAQHRGHMGTLLPTTSRGLAVHGYLWVSSRSIRTASPQPPGRIGGVDTLSVGLCAMRPDLRLRLDVITRSRCVHEAVMEHTCSRHTGLLR